MKFLYDFYNIKEEEMEYIDSVFTMMKLLGIELFDLISDGVVVSFGFKKNEEYCILVIEESSKNIDLSKHSYDDINSNEDIYVGGDIVDCFKKISLVIVDLN